LPGLGRGGSGPQFFPQPARAGKDSALIRFVRTKDTLLEHAMPQSDAYMEISDPETWGETRDEQFGMGPKGRQQGAFEITSFSFSVTSNREDDDDEKKKHHHHDQHHHDHHSHGDKKTAKHSQPEVKSFSINKWIDKGSPDLFLACCRQLRMDWAKIFLRETGEKNRMPWLILEFQGVYVDSLKWNLSPGTGGEEAKDQETVEFSFETILIKYCRQKLTGGHHAPKIKGWNRMEHNSKVDELEKNPRQQDDGGPDDGQD
jgi:type VI secretion system Hcp family effector